MKLADVDMTESAAENVGRDTGDSSGNTRAGEWIGWVALAVLPTAALTLRNVLLPWVFMWLLAFAIFAGCKWQTFWEARAGARRTNWKRIAAYLLLWPGMNAKEFLATGADKRRIAPREWLAAIGKTLAGAGLFWIAARSIASSHPLAMGWLAMIGIVLILHFGIFQLIALGWQSVGIHAEPIMQHPLESQSLSEFWGKRWNLGFRKLTHGLVFLPLQKRLGIVPATLGAFLASGLIHDLVISVPARAGYGLPTAYFLVQGLGVLAERSGAGRRLGLGRGMRGRLWMGLVTAGPVIILFHPWFVMRVMLPFLHAVGG